MLGGCQSKDLKLSGCDAEHRTFQWLIVALIFCAGVCLDCAAEGQEDPPPVMPPPPVAPIRPPTSGEKTPIKQVSNDSGPNPEKIKRYRQWALDQYREAIEEIHVKYTKDDQKILRKNLLNQARTEFRELYKKAIDEELTIEQSIDRLIENIQLSLRSFRFKDSENFRADWAVEAARVCVDEVKGASDLDKEGRTAKMWFEQYCYLMQRLSRKTVALGAKGQRVLSTASPIFQIVLKSDNDVSFNERAADDYADNLQLVKRLFPIREDDKSRNSREITYLNKTCERHAATLYKLESDKR